MSWAKALYEILELEEVFQDVFGVESGINDGYTAERSITEEDIFDEEARLWIQGAKTLLGKREEEEITLLLRVDRGVPYVSASRKKD